MNDVPVCCVCIQFEFPSVEKLVRKSATASAKQQKQNKVFMAGYPTMMDL